MDLQMVELCGGGPDLNCFWGVPQGRLPSFIAAINLYGNKIPPPLV